MNKQEIQDKIQRLKEQQVQLEKELTTVDKGHFVLEESGPGYMMCFDGSIVQFSNCTETEIQNLIAYQSYDSCEKISFKQWFERSLMALKEKNRDVCTFDKTTINYYVNIRPLDGIPDIYCCSLPIAVGTIYFADPQLLNTDLENRKDLWDKYISICKELS